MVRVVWRSLVPSTTPLPRASSLLLSSSVEITTMYDFVPGMICLGLRYRFSLQRNLQHLRWFCLLRWYGHPERHWWRCSWCHLGLHPQRWWCRLGWSHQRWLRLRSWWYQGCWCMFSFFSVDGCRSAPRECSSGMSRTVSPDVPGPTTTTPSSLLPEPWTLSLSARSPRSTLLMMTSSTPLPMKPTSSKSCLLFAVYFFSTSWFFYFDVVCRVVCWTKRKWTKQRVWLHWSVLVVVGGGQLCDHRLLRSVQVLQDVRCGVVL